MPVRPSARDLAPRSPRWPRCRLVRPLRPVLLLGCLCLAGCPEEPAITVADLGSPDPDDSACYARPSTHLEILNACTSAQSLSKQPVLPLLRPDGTLPPLP
jgi:hypothetical protein